ncbi:MAG TPA: hypothetical protein PLG15_07215 [Candidatus Gastranaerophilaceae bacterium]|nr:hypothetical protein [Candidatus Gastranaerophilaceae bacterium]
MVTDVRVPHELEIFKAAGAIAIRVEASRQVRASRGELIGENDVTEVGLDHITDWGFVIENNSTYEKLKEQTFEVIKQLSAC